MQKKRFSVSAVRTHGGEIMDAVLMKYIGRNGEYLVFDTSKNTLQMDEHAVRTICSRNFGIGSMGVIAGDGLGIADNMKWFDPSGRLIEMDEDASGVARSFLEDVKQKRSNWSTSSGDAGMPYQTGKIFLTERFIDTNRLKIA